MHRLDHEYHISLPNVYFHLRSYIMDSVNELDLVWYSTYSINKTRPEVKHERYALN